MGRYHQRKIRAIRKLIRQGLSDQQIGEAAQTSAKVVGWERERMKSPKGDGIPEGEPLTDEAIAACDARIAAFLAHAAERRGDDEPPPPPVDVPVIHTETVGRKGWRLT